MIAATLVQGNQALFNECERTLADKEYDGNTLECFYTERNKRKLNRPDMDSQEYVGWINADGSENGFQVKDRMLTFSLVAIGVALAYIVYKK